MAPEGWVYIEAARMWWSAADAIYLDTTKGLYWDYACRQWYDPRNQQWTKPGPGPNTDTLPRAPPAGHPPVLAEAEVTKERGDTEEARLNREHADFAYDEGSGYYYSESNDIYKDPESGMRYCANKDQWYDPESKQWC